MKVVLVTYTYNDGRMIVPNCVGGICATQERANALIEKLKKTNGDFEDFETNETEVLS